MKIYSVLNKEFKKYGEILSGYDFCELIDVMNKNTPMPDDCFTYVASEPKLEALNIYKELTDRAFGGMPAQLGYCNGTNYVLNCLEYHIDSEFLIACTDAILILGQRSDITDGKYDTSNAKVFFIPKGVGVELYATTLHYAPLSAKVGQGYRMANLLARGTNDTHSVTQIKSDTDKYAGGKNKWILSHPDSDEAKNGTYIGLVGENIDISKYI